MAYLRKEDFEADPNWYPSIGEQFWNYNYRSGHDHVVCNSTTGECSTHYDKDDPHESISSLIKHLAENKTVQAIVGALVVDEIAFQGKYRKKVKKAIFD